MSTIKSASFPRNNIEGAIQYVKDNAHLSKSSGDDILVYTTGLGGHEFKEKLESELGIK